MINFIIYLRTTLIKSRIIHFWLITIKIDFIFSFSFTSLTILFILVLSIGLQSFHYSSFLNHLYFLYFVILLIG